MSLSLILHNPLVSNSYQRSLRTVGIGWRYPTAFYCDVRREGKQRGWLATVFPHLPALGENVSSTVLRVFQHEASGGSGLEQAQSWAESVEESS